MMELDKFGDWDKIQTLPAEVAELADALRSGRSESTLMRVQIPPSAHSPWFMGFFLFRGLLEFLTQGKMKLCRDGSAESLNYRPSSSLL